MLACVRAVLPYFVHELLHKRTASHDTVEHYVCLLHM